MKRLTCILFAACSLIMASCGSGTPEESSEASTEVTLPAVLANGTMSLDLSDYFLPFSLYVPDSSRGIAEVEETGFGETIIRVGSTYNLVIAEGGDMAAKKAEIAGDLMFTNTIVEEGEDYIVYKAEITGSALDPEFHFYAVKDINGTVYEFRDNKDEGPFAESIVRLMTESVNHIVPNKSAT